MYILITKSMNLLDFNLVKILQTLIPFKANKFSVLRVWYNISVTIEKRKTLIGLLYDAWTQFQYTCLGFAVFH